MSKLETMEMVSEMTGLDFGYVVEAASYFRNYNEAFNYLYLSEESPDRLEPAELIKQLSSVTVQQMQDINVNTPLEYLVMDNRHTYITPKGIGYLRITR